MRCKTIYWASHHTEFTDTESSIGLWIIGASDTGFGLMSVSESKGIEYLFGPSSFNYIDISLVNGDRLQVTGRGGMGPVPRYFAKISMFEHDL